MKNYYTENKFPCLLTIALYQSSCFNNLIFLLMEIIPLECDIYPTPNH